LDGDGLFFYNECYFWKYEGGVLIQRLFSMKEKMYAVRIVFYLLCLIIGIAESGSVVDSLAENGRIGNIAVFFPQLHFYADIGRYLHRQTPYLKRHFYVGSSISIDPYWLQLGRRVECLTHFEVNPMMGRTKPDNVVFDPIDIDYALTSIVLIDIDFGDILIGEDHHCFHEVDRKDFPTVYWNKIFGGVQSSNYVPALFAQNLCDTTGNSVVDKMAWKLTWGYYLKRFFGLFSESTINYENYRIQEVQFSYIYAPLQWGRWFVTLDWDFSAGTYKDKDTPRSVYWNSRWSVAGHFFTHKRGAALRVSYFRDQMPLLRGKTRFSKHRLFLTSVETYF